jgi:protein-disulfide isomerase
MANNKPPANARTGARRPASSGGGSNRSVFYGVLIAIVVLGIAAIFYLAKRPTTASADQQAAYEALQRNYANAGPPQPHVRGNPNAPVVIEEFADFECPSCGRFATITEPDVRKNLVDAGQVFYKYYDFPLPMHRNSQAASNAAACAEEQGKFWEMHDQLFAGQDQWGLSASENGEVTDNPRPIFEGYAKTIGLNVPQWDQCFDSHKYQSRINANLAEGFRRHVEETPTFYVNGKQAVGAQSYDDIQRLVNEAKATAASAPPATSANQKATVPRTGVADTTKH